MRELLNSRRTGLAALGGDAKRHVPLSPAAMRWMVNGHCETDEFRKLMLRQGLDDEDADAATAQQGFALERPTEPSRYLVSSDPPSRLICMSSKSFISGQVERDAVDTHRYELDLKAFVDGLAQQQVRPFPKQERKRRPGCLLPGH